MAQDSTAVLPLYKQIAEDIRGEVSRRVYAPGDRIPAEAELSETYGVSRITVRKAIQDLVKDGILTKIQGKGTFVNQQKLLRKITQVAQIQSFTDACRANGMEPSARVLSRDITDADAEARAFFGIAEKDDPRLLTITRLRSADGIPIMIENNTVRLEGFESFLTRPLEDVSIFDEMEAVSGRRPESSGECLLDIVRATPETAEKLQAGAGEPLFRETVDFLDAAGAPLCRGLQYIVGSRYTFSI
jgi:GntR family transcriptional regulator